MTPHDKLGHHAYKLLRRCTGDSAFGSNWGNYARVDARAPEHSNTVGVVLQAYWLEA